MSDKKHRKALQRGLKALISEEAIEEAEQAASVSRETTGPNLNELPVSEILTNPFQPRTEFDPEELEELKNSIAKHGVIEPIIVRRSKGQYELVSGERRLRAVKALGKTSIPAVIRDRVSDREMQILSLVENQIRANLNDLEIALGYNELINQFSYTHDKVAEDTGKSRSFVTNTLRLLKLPDEIKKALQEGKISSGHARALLSFDDESKRLVMLKRILDEGLNVRQIEKLAGEGKEEKKEKASKKPSKDADVLHLESRLVNHFKTKVEIVHVDNKGRITIHFTDVSDLNRITDLIQLG